MDSKTCDRKMMETAADEIEGVIYLLDTVIRSTLWPVDPVLAAKVEVARNILEGVDNDIHDAYIGWDA